MTDWKRLFADTKVGDVYDLIVKSPSKVQRSAKIWEVIDQMLMNPTSRKVYVIDVEGNLVGVVNTEMILRLIGYRVGVKENSSMAFVHFLQDTLKEEVEGIMILKVRPVKKETPLTEALKNMIEFHVNDLPVVDDDHKLIGELMSSELFIAAKRLFESP